VPLANHDVWMNALLHRLVRNSTICLRKTSIPQGGTLRRAVFLLVIVAILVAGGYISNQISTRGAEAIPGLRIQTENAEATPTVVTPTKGGFFFIYLNIAVGSVIGFGIVLAIIFRLLNREVERAHKQKSGDQGAARSS